MTPEQHARQAEAALELAHDATSPEAAMFKVAVAQVHAILSLRPPKIRSEAPTKAPSMEDFSERTMTGPTGGSSIITNPHVPEQPDE